MTQLLKDRDESQTEWQHYEEKVAGLPGHLTSPAKGTFHWMHSCESCEEAVELFCSSQQRVALFLPCIRG